MFEDDPNCLRIFAKGLPYSLAATCIDVESLQTFEGWAKAAQKHNRNYLIKQNLKPPGSGQPNQCRNNAFTWNFNRSNQGNCRNNQGGGLPRLPARDPNAMDTSASAQVSKATTEADKECYRKEGRCYECGKQGHIVQACPAKG